MNYCEEHKCESCGPCLYCAIRARADGKDTSKRPIFGIKIGEFDLVS